MADTASLHIDATKPDVGSIDQEALGEALAPGLAVISQALADAGFARSDIVIVNSLNDSTVHQGSGEDFDPIP